MLKGLSRFKIEFYVGLLVLFGFGLLFYASVRLMQTQPKSNNAYVISAFFDNVTGLKPGTAIRIAGIKIGAVKGIELVNDQAKVTMFVYDKYTLYSNATATIASIGILGDKYIKLTSGNASYSRLKNHMQIKRILPAADLDTLVESATSTLNNIQKVSASLYKSIGSPEGEKRIDAILNHVEDLTNNLNIVLATAQQEFEPLIVQLSQLTQQVSTVVKDNSENLDETMTNLAKISHSLGSILEKNQQQIASTIKNVDRLLASLSTEAPRMTNNVNHILEDNRAHLENMLNQVNQASQNLNLAMNDLENITSTVKQGQGTVGRLLKDDTVVEKLNQTLDSVNKAVAPVNKVQFKVAFDSAYLGTQKKFKSQVNVIIQPARDHFYQLGYVQSPNGSIREEDGSSGKLETIGNYSINFMIAQRYFDSQIKIGLKESKAGISFNQFFDDDLFNINADIWDFSRDNLNPHMAMGVSYIFLHNFNINAGVDDLLNIHRDKDNHLFITPYLGVGVQFTEDYIKSVLGLAVSAVQ